jgi:GNAT superfamily N-acetyltransferase
MNTSMADDRIRPATEGDADAVLPLMREYCRFYEVEAPNDDGLREMVRALTAVDDSEGILLVGCAPGGEVVGFAACGWKWSSLRGARVVVLEDLYVDPAARAKGLGRALIEACAERARELGAPIIEWLTHPDNARARSVYDAIGAVPDTFIEYELELHAQG